MKTLILVLCLVGGCVAGPVSSVSSPENECLEIGAEMAETIKMLRIVGHEPDPARIDLLIEQATDFDECMADQAPN